MPVHELRVSGYRSIANLTIALKRVNVLVGPNGCGKSNLYQSLALIWSAARGEFARTVAQEGGMDSMFWAGPRKGKKEIQLGVVLDGADFEMTVATAPSPCGSMFPSDPSIVQEKLTGKEKGRPIAIVERGSGVAYVRDREGFRTPYGHELRREESILAQVTDPYQYPHLLALRNSISNWRFYHQFRSDAESPLRQRQVPVRTFIMAADGRDLASALRTICENGDDLTLNESIREAFDAARLSFEGGISGLEVGLESRGLNRRLGARELSDGTLRYLCLLGALLSPIPPPLIALNEPESSLHPQLLEPLAKLIVRASLTSQIWLTTHSRPLAEAISAHSGVAPIELVKINGETMRAGRTDKRVYFTAEED